MNTIDDTPIPWLRVERGRQYELQSVTSSDALLQERIGPPFVRKVVGEYERSGDPPPRFGLPTPDKHPFGPWARFATVEPATDENPEHVKVRYCANYIVLREVP